jgi:zinc protease
VIPAVERYSIDGVPVLWSRGVAGRNAAALIFRVGHFDETLPVSGVTHMVEHLTFADKPDARYKFNANVTGRFTTFLMQSGDPADIEDFVTTVCQGLAADQSAVVDRERRILRTEAASRGGAGALGACLAERYGATGPGLVHYQEFGLQHLRWPQIEYWRRRWFTVGNAVLWIAGPVPPRLRIELPSGPAMAQQELRPLRPELPGFIAAGRGGIGMSLEGSRTLEMYVALDVLQRRLTRVLRHEHGLTYDVQRLSEDLDRDLMHTWMAADALSDQVSIAAHTMLSTFESLAETGCDRAEIEEYARRIQDAYESPGGSVLALQHRAHDILSARKERDLSQTPRLVAQLDQRSIGEAARALYEGMIVAAPGTLPAVQGRMRRLPLWSGSALSGTEHKSRDSSAVLTTSDQGVMLTAEPGHHVTVRYDSVAALLRWNDGRQTLVGADGFAIQLDPDEWEGGLAVPDAVAAHVRADVIVPIDASASPRPGRGAAAADQATSAAAAGGQPAGTASAGRPPHSRPWPVRLAVTFWVVVLVFGALALAGGDVSGGAVFAIIGLAGIAWMEYRYARRRRKLR